MCVCVCVRVPLMHSRSRCRASCVTPAAGIQAVVKSAVGASDHSHRPSRHSSSCDKRALKKGTPKPLQRFTERHHNPSQAVVFMYVGHSAASSLSLHLWHQKECVEGETDGWTDRRMEGRMDGWREGVPCFFVSPSLRLFGEFADDADQCSIFILKTLVVCSQVNQDLVVKKKKKELPLKTN